MDAASEVPQPRRAVALKAMNDVDQPGTQFSAYLDSQPTYFI